MTREVKGLLLLAAMLLAFALGGCSGEDEPEPQDEPKQAALTTAETGIEITDPAYRALVAAVRSSASRYPTFDRLPDEGIVSTGLLVCVGFEAGVAMPDVVEAVAEGAGTEPAEAVSFIGLAVGEVCPEYASAVY